MENNKLIAEFMGLKNHLKNKGITKILIDGHEHIQDWECYDTERDMIITPIEMKFDTSWDWLMPVVHKIKENDLDFDVLEIGLPIEDVYQAVVEFIKQTKTK